MSVQDVITILSSSAIATALSGVLVFLARNWISERLKASIQHEYDQKLETHKAQLKSQTEAEIIRLKAQLEIAAAERNVQYSRIFEKTAEVIAQTYEKLLALSQAAEDYTQLLERRDDPSRKQLAENFRQTSIAFLEYFPPKKIYLPKETAEKIRVLSNTMHRATRQFSMALAVGRGQTREPETYDKLLDEFFKSSDQIPKLLELLEDDFQKLLGFSGTMKSVG